MKERFSHTLKHFRELTSYELYGIIRLRNEVFVVEQNCIFQDADNKDLYCYHLMLYEQNELVGYARLVPAGLSYEEMSIGRVVTSKIARGSGAGRVLMQLSIKYCRELFGTTPIRIGAQRYAEKFYTSLGFVSTDIFYDEDGIEHVEMILT